MSPKKPPKKPLSPTGKTPSAQPRKRGGGPRLLSRMVEGMTRPIFGKRGFSGAKIINEWAAIAGPDLAKVSRPERITFSRDGKSGGVLHLRVATGGVATEIQHLEPLIKDRINSYFGYAAITAIRISQGPIGGADTAGAPRPRELGPDEEKAIGESLASVEDNEIRGALEGLARSIARRKPRP